MQKILDRTQESLAQAFASLAKNARRQQRVYLATIGSLMLMVVIFALVLAVVAALKQLEYRRTFASQNATDLSLLLHREESFLRRAEFTLDYYYSATEVRRAPDAVERSIAQTGAARGKVDRVDADFDIVIGQATRAAWGTRFGDNLGRLYESAQSTLVTQQAFELQQRATLIGLDENYAVILPSLARSVTGASTEAEVSATPPPQETVAGTLRETIERELQSQTGKRVPGKGERVWVGPYRDPLENTSVMSAVSAYYEGDTPVTLISVSIPLDVLAARIAPPDSAGATLLMAPDRRFLVSSAALDAQTGAMLQQTVAETPPHVFHYGREGAIFHEPLMQGFGSLVGYVPWGVLAVALGWQLAAIGGSALLVLLAIALTARFFGLRLLRNAFAETSRALESETINHILVSATPIGLCIVRQSDYSILTANALATELLQIQPGTSRLPPHIAAEFLAQAPDQPSVTAFARVAAFVAAAQQQPVALPNANAQTVSASNEAGDTPAQFLQVTYAPARYAGENVLFCAILDVTAQHTLEQQLRQAQQTSEAMMRARTNFFAAMSHEIRTPLNALLGNLELFARTPGLEAHAQRLATLNVAGDALRRVVNDILDFSKIDAGEMLLMREPFALIDAFESIALSYAPMRSERAVRFFSLLSPTLDRTVIGDRMRIAQIVNNLLSNAFKFTSSGKITLHAEVTDDAQGRPVLNCRVSDSGPGMGEELVARLFKPFVQGEAGTSRGAEGTGLGLVICARLCQLMGGTISAESVLDVGSVFHMSIPLAAAPGDMLASAPVVAARGTLLTLCQEREAAELLDRWLEHFGWTGHTVPTLVAAQAWLRVNRPKALIVSGAYDLDAIATLRALQPVSVVWVTRAGPHRPEARGEGVLEVSEFSRTAVRSAIELAVEGTPAAAAPAMTTASKSTSAIASAAVPSLTTHPALQGLTVLVAEDNPLIQSLIAEQLAALGCVPTIAGDGKQALGLFERTPFDVVLTDIHMPAMDGYELFVALRKLDADVPLLAFSAVAENQEAQSWRERGFSGYVSKPASLGELQAALLAVAPAAADRAARAVAPASASAAATESTLAADDKARYTAMLKEHLKNDLPRLLAIVDEEDRQALAGWAHSASGAFVIVQESRFVEECRQLQRLCNDSERWIAEMDERAVSLHDALCDHYRVDEESTH
ncbi:ATP-binding protein [Paraburkholderia rhynchosiae]|uniref:Virulence sensor protein BvgS n=1 Tax=Paraburkholderia rhynchosiae TaxID=487049 RepID=A0A2N7WNW0_9BURK|nr:ATP-binding protein [Paraburkholderia rhynchosiae]PMS31099.1 hybrid sensor histidine kinase/response regulator [Paraburkholderia rhynchosiae]CAB3701886.1 Sensor histidine kinase RcsC [Paraburkholderia rhynchosiae]